jgi:hypothetical protein
MDFFLPKPIRRPELKKVLSKYCPTIHEEEVENGGSSNTKVNGIRKSINAEDRSSIEVAARNSPTKATTISEIITDGDANGTTPSS